MIILRIGIFCVTFSTVKSCEGTRLASFIYFINSLFSIPEVFASFPFYTILFKRSFQISFCCNEMNHIHICLISY